MDSHFGNFTRKVNSNSHPNVDKDGEAWQILAAQNTYDIELYEYAVMLFGEQKERIDQYGRDMQMAQEQ